MSGFSSAPSAEAVDVVIVGAGFAGLAAARRLIRTGLSVLVLEARDRVGGRAYTVRGAGAGFDLGGQWVGPGQERIRALLREQGRAEYPQFEQGRIVMAWADGRRDPFEGNLPPLPWCERLAALRVFGVLQLVCSPWVWRLGWPIGAAGQLEGVSLAGWIEARTRSRAVRELLFVLCRGVFCCEPREISAYFAFASIRACGGLNAVLAKRGGAQESRVAGGLQPVAEQLAGELGERLRLGCPVREIRWGGADVVVLTERGPVRARHCILTAPPASWGALAFSPELPPAKRELVGAMPMGAVIKCFAFYREAFWRAGDFSGEVISGRAPVSFVVDACLEDGKPALVAFCFGDEARRCSALGPARRKELVLAALAELFDDPRAAQPIDYRDHDWVAEPGTWGGYSGILGPHGVPGRMRALREPCGALHFAGTESADVSRGPTESCLGRSRSGFCPDGRERSGTRAPVPRALQPVGCPAARAQRLRERRSFPC